MRRSVQILKRIAAGRAALAALVLVALYVVMALLARWITPHDPLAISDALLAPPSVSHWMGTDQLGRDIFSRVIYGAGISLRVAVPAVAMALGVGAAVGLIAGYFRGWVDVVVSRCMDVMFAVPEVLLALVVMAILGVGLGQITLAIAVVYAPIFARICRGAVIATMSEPYVEAARALGLPQWRVMVLHILPGAAPALIVQTTLSLAFAVLAEATLSFLGLSGETDAPSWGLMLRQGKDLMELAWWVAVFPGVAVSLAVLSLNVLGDGLRDALDPRL